MKKTFLFLITLIFLLGCSQSKKEEIKIGAILPLTGPVAAFGQWAKNGIDLGLEEYNRAYPELNNIIVIYEDSKFDAKTGLSAYNKLKTNDNVDAVIVAMSKVAIPILEQPNRDIPVLLQDVTFPNITERYDNVIRHFIQSDREAKVLSDFAIEDLKLKTCGILYVNDEAGIGAKDAFSELFTKNGKILITESFEANTKDVKTQVTKIINAKPECIFLFGNGPSWALAIRTVRELNYQGEILTNAALYIPNFREIAGESVEGVYFTYPYIDTTEVSSKKFVDAYIEKYGEFPPIEAAYGYDLFKILSSVALVESKNLSFVDKLSKVKELEGAFGKLTIPINGDIVTKVALAQYNNGIKNITIIK